MHQSYARTQKNIIAKPYRVSMSIPAVKKCNGLVNYVGRRHQINRCQIQRIPFSLCLTMVLIVR